MKKLFISLLMITLCKMLLAQNVGIGVATPTHGKLEIISASGNQLVTRTSATSPGISFFNASAVPSIGFNSMINGGYSFLGAGYGSFLQYNPADGRLKYYSSSSIGVANAVMGGTTPFLFSVSPNGNFGLGAVDPLEGFHLLNKNIRLDDALGNKSITINSNGWSSTGSISLFYDDGTENISIRGSDGTNQSGEIIFRKPGVVGTTLEIDGDYGGTSRSRIIVDEIQIKGGADFAEYFDIMESDIEAEPGMLVCIDEFEEGKMAICSKAYDKKVAGVISRANGIKPGMMMGHKGTVADGKHPVAISGRVYVKAETYGNTIKPGDLLTTSSTPGYAMKAVNNKKATGAIIGKAMGTLEAGKKGFVLVLLSIQ